jgi:hypothetical protein
VNIQMLCLTLQGCVLLATSYLLKKSSSTGVVFHSRDCVTDFNVMNGSIFSPVLSLQSLCAGE